MPTSLLGSSARLTPVQLRTTTLLEPATRAQHNTGFWSPKAGDKAILFCGRQTIELVQRATT